MISAITVRKEVNGMAKKSMIPGFSWKRATGVTSAKRKIAKATGIPTTKSGRKRKAQSILWKSLFWK